MDDWQVDPRANSLSQGANRWNYGIASAKAPMSLDASRARRLEYTSAPLAAAREITGHPVVRIQLGRQCRNADVYAYLEDVAPDGTSLLVSEGQLRADFHRLKPDAGHRRSGRAAARAPGVAVPRIWAAWITTRHPWPTVGA